jgi:DNA-binding NtrC family response regulator
LLDEIGDMPLSIQAKFLRALEERQFYPVGSDRPVAVDVRIIVATKKDLREEVNKGLFREDLFYRLYVIPIRLPSLRERKEDILPLANHFLNKAARQMKKNVKGFAPELLQKLLVYDWPGNIRELQNLIERAVILSSGLDLVVPLSELKASHTANHLAQLSTLESAEREHIVRVLGEARGNKLAAARRLGISRRTLYRRLERHGLMGS